HVSLSLWKRTADTKDTAPESTRRPWCRFYPWCPLYTSCPLYPSYPLCPSRNSRIHFLRVDVVGLDRLVDDRFLDLPVARQRGQRPDDHVPVVDLEEIAQPRAVLAAAEAVGAERHQRARQPAVDRVGQRLDVVRRGDEHPRRLLQALGH